MLSVARLWDVSECKNNQRLIADAVDQWALEQNKPGTAALPASTVLAPYIKGGWPLCLVGETYTLSGTVAAGTNICSVAAHN